MTIPIRQKNLEQTIKNTKVTDKRWSKKHWTSISQNYSKSKYFKDSKDMLDMLDMFEELYLNCEEDSLSLINYRFITAINKILGIQTKILWSSDFTLVDKKTERLLSICKDCKATEYISGPAAQNYLNESLF